MKNTIISDSTITKEKKSEVKPLFLLENPRPILIASEIYLDSIYKPIYKDPILIFFDEPYILSQNVPSLANCIISINAADINSVVVSALAGIPSDIIEKGVQKQYREAYKSVSKKGFLFQYLKPSEGELTYIERENLNDLMAKNTKRTISFNRSRTAYLRFLFGIEAQTFDAIFKTANAGILYLDEKTRKLLKQKTK